MGSTISFLVLLAGAALAAVLAWVGMAGAAQWTERRQHGYLHWVLYALVLLLGLASLLSGRDLTTNFLLQEFQGMEPPPVKHPVLAVLQPVVSLLLLAISGERILTHWLLRKSEPVQPLLPLAFAFFWLGTTASPALLGAHPHVSHDYLYPLIIGLAATLATPRELDLVLRATRNGLLLLMLGGLLLVPVAPTLVMDSQYTQGLIPGLARFAGLSTHPVSMGLLTQLGLLCLLARPFERRWLNRLAWLMGLGVLVFAQSKTAWVTFLLCSAILLLLQHGPALRQRLSDPRRPDASILLVLGLMLGVAALVMLLMFGNLGERLERFFTTPEGAQLASLTGRDRIWAIAWQEWARYPVFGYGPQIWGEEYRYAIGMVNATHAHNQFMDTLSRAGGVGTAALCLYALLLLWLSLRYARITRGLSVALFICLLLRALSEVPLLLFGYGPELITHLLLLATLSAAAQAHARKRVQAEPVEPPAPPTANRAHGPGGHRRGRPAGQPWAWR